MSKYRVTGKLKSFLTAPLWMVLIFIVSDIFLFIQSPKAGVIGVIAIGAYLAGWLIVYRMQKDAVMSEMISFATEYGQVQKKLMTDFSVPYAIADDQGRLLWFNNAFAECTGKDRRTFRKSITSIFSEITRDKFPGPGEETEYSLEFGTRQFRIEMMYVSIEELVNASTILDSAADAEGSNSLMAIYLYDETELYSYIRKCREERVAVGMIYLDNYDEALESVEEVRRSLLTALIDRKISKYFSETDCLVKKFEKDKYLVVMRNGSLDMLKQQRFEILDDVKTVNIGNEMAVTISIGIGANAGSINRNLEFARVAIDLALGRGGDQVVLKDRDGITYYGGKSQAVEKSTRVKARVKAHALKEFIYSKEKVVVMGHKLLDVDSFGSAIGIYRAARTLSKNAYIVIDNPTSSTRPFIDEFRNNQDYDPHMFLTIHEAKEMVDNDTLLVVVDTNKPDYTECEDLLRMTKTVVVLDHHRRGDKYIKETVLSYIEPYASSACEMVAEILQYFSEGVHLKGIEADALYAGIMVDTDNFMQKTGVRTFEAAAYLRRNGADVTRVRKMFREKIEDYRVKGATLSKAELYRDHFAISVCPHDDGVESPTIIGSQVANQMLDIIDVKASFVLTEYKGVIYVSARAIDEVNVQLIMERMGGGGHLNMAGCQLEKMTMEEAIAYLKKTIDQMMEEGEIS